MKKGRGVRRSGLRVTGAAGAIEARREGKCDDERSGARAVFEQIGPAGRAGSDAEALRRQDSRCESEGVDCWVVAGGGAECGGDSGATVAALPARWVAAPDADSSARYGLQIRSNCRLSRRSAGGTTASRKCCVQSVGAAVAGGAGDVRLGELTTGDVAAFQVAEALPEGH